MGSGYVIGVFTCYQSNKTQEFKKAFLSFSKLEYETIQSTEQQFLHIHYVMNYYSNSWKNMISIVDDNNPK